MPIPAPVRHAARTAYQFKLMNGRELKELRFTSGTYLVSVDMDDVRVECGDKVWRVPIAKSWASL